MQLNNRHLVILALSGFLTSFGAHIVATNLPAYAQKAAIGTFMIGLIIAVYDFAELFAKPLAGMIADKRGMKLTLLVGIAIFISGSLLYLIIPPSLLLLVRFIQGVGAAALSAISITLVARYFPLTRGRSVGIYNAIKGAGYVVAPATGGWIAGRYGFSVIFCVTAALGVLAFAFSLLLPNDKHNSVALDDDDDLSFGLFATIFKDARLLSVFGVILINMFLVGILFGFLPVYLYGIGLSVVR